MRIEPRSLQEAFQQGLERALLQSRSGNPFRSASLEFVYRQSKCASCMRGVFAEYHNGKDQSARDGGRLGETARADTKIMKDVRGRRSW